MSSPNHDDFPHLKIPLQNIISATNNFDTDNMIGANAFERDYKGQFLWSGELIKIHVRRWSNKEWDDEKEQQFWMDIFLLSTLKHKNVVFLVGFCDENGEKIIILKLETKGSLNSHLKEPMSLTWVRRLKICVGISHVLSYIHYDEPRDFSVIHRDIRSGMVMLNDEWEPKLCEFKRSMKIKASQRHNSFHDSKVWYLNGYGDPAYNETKSVNHKSDMYSFGIIMFELLCSRRAVIAFPYNKYNKYLAPLAIAHYREKTLYDIIDPDLWKQMDPQSFIIVAEAAYDCLNEEQSIRPHIDEIVLRLEKALELQLKRENYVQHLKIELQAIKSATNEFDDSKCIGKGGFGKVYKGELVHSKGRSIVAIKRLDRAFGRHPEFWDEIFLLSQYRHDSIVSLLGFCENWHEKILVYDYASKSSLDLYLNDKDLMWVQRLKICIGAARGLAYLHNPGETQQSVLHRDIKSSNILLDENWNARISDFGGSKFGSVIRRDNWVGTIGYYDPLYVETGLLTKESDVYSFGVVLFEILCGRLCIKYGHNKYLTELVHECYEQNTIAEIVYCNIKDEINPQSLKAFTTIAYQCLNQDQEQRPLMTEVVKELESALTCQEDYEIWEPRLPKDYKEIIQMSKCPKHYSIIKKEDLYNIFCEGILLQHDKVLLSIVGNGERNEMISSTTFSYINSCSHAWKYLSESRFGTVVEMLHITNLFIKIKAKAQLLSPNVFYGVYLVFKFCDSRKFSSKHVYVNLKYRKGHESLHAYFATWRDEEWMMIELYRFLNQNEDVVFEFLVEHFSSYYCGDVAVYVEGIEFRAIAKGKYEEIGLLKEVQVLKSDFIVDQVKRLPTNFEEIFNVCTNYNELFWLGEVKRKKLLVLSAKAALYKFSNADTFSLKPPAQSRFQEVIELMPQQVFHISCTIKSQMLSLDIDYVCYLVFKVSEKCQGLHFPVKLRDLLHQENNMAECFYFITPSPVNINDTTRVPKQREDGWMEIEVWKFNPTHEFKDDSLSMNMKFTSHEGNISGLIICGLEFRPMLEGKVDGLPLLLDSLRIESDKMISGCLDWLMYFKYLF